MRNIFEKSTFKWIIAWFFVCFLFWVVVFADWTNLKSFRNTWGSDAPNIENKLSAETWNSVLQELDQLKVALSWALNDPSIAIPKWAVMAFDLKTWCPTGWDPFTLANDRFLMWTSTWSEVESIWWKSTSSLGVKNIPAHYHFYKDTVYSESFSPTEANYYVNYNYYDYRPGANNYGGTYNRINNQIKLAQWTEDLWWGAGLWGPSVWLIYWSDEGWDHDNYPIYWVRATSNEICSSDFWKYGRGQYNQEDWLGGRLIGLGAVGYDSTHAELSQLRKAYCYWDGKTNLPKDKGGQEFSVQNPYVKVIYCKKQ